MSRIPYPTLDRLSPVKHARIFDPARKVVLNVSKMALHIPDPLWIAMADLGRATIYGTTMAARLREMIIVRVAHLQQSEYELFHHRVIAANEDVTRAELAALEGGDLNSLASDEKALIDFVSEVVTNVSPSDATLAVARAHYPDSLLFETVVIIGGYMMTARIAAVGGVECDPQPVESW
jgi:alkylhydroperoxidase family enzyme